MQIGFDGAWRTLLQPEIENPGFQSLAAFVDAERSQRKVFPAESDVFAALRGSPYEKTRVVVLGQDPYHGEGQAHGLCFSVPPGVKTPPSLVNIYKELESDLAIPIAKHGV